MQCHASAPETGNRHAANITDQIFPNLMLKSSVTGFIVQQEGLFWNVEKRRQMDFPTIWHPGTPCHPFPLSAGVCHSVEPGVPGADHRSWLFPEPADHLEIPCYEQGLGPQRWDSRPLSPCHLPAVHLLELCIRKTGKVNLSAWKVLSVTAGISELSLPFLVIFISDPRRSVHLTALMAFWILFLFSGLENFIHM